MLIRGHSIQKNFFNLKKYPGAVNFWISADYVLLDCFQPKMIMNKDDNLFLFEE